MHFQEIYWPLKNVTCSLKYTMYMHVQCKAMFELQYICGNTSTGTGTSLYIPVKVDITCTWVNITCIIYTLNFIK